MVRKAFQRNLSPLKPYSRDVIEILCERVVTVDDIADVATKHAKLKDTVRIGFQQDLARHYGLVVLPVNRGAHNGYDLVFEDRECLKEMMI